MASLKDAAERQAFSLAIDATLKSLNKDRERFAQYCKPRTEVYGKQFPF